MILRLLSALLLLAVFLFQDFKGAIIIKPIIVCLFLILSFVRFLSSKKKINNNIKQTKKI